MRYSLVTPATLAPTLDTIAHADAISLDTETKGLMWWRDDLVGVSVGTSDHAWYFPFRHQPGGNLPLSDLDLLRDACANPKHLAMWNGNFDWHVLERCGWTMRPWLDGQIAAYTIDETRITFKLEHVAGYELGIGKDVAEGEEKALKAALKAIKAPAGKAAKAHMYRLRPEQVAPYACRDARSTFDLMAKFGRQLSGSRLGKVFESLMEQQYVLHREEARGIRVDPVALVEETALARQKIAEMKPEIERRMALKPPPVSSKTGKPFASWPLATSPDQLRYWLGSEDTTKKTIKKLAAAGNEDAQLLLRFRQWHKAITTYYVPISQCLQGDILHPSFRLTSSAVRLSCGRPNMYAIPRDANQYGVKRCFVAPPGKLLMEWDYKQAEIYLAAHYSQDPELMRICLDGLDIHKLVAERLDVDRDKIAKPLNFAIPYGVGAEKFAAMVGISVAAARQYLQGHYETFARWRQFYFECQAFAEKHGKVVLWSGRERRHHLYPKWYQKDVKRHSAMNNVIQGAVNEIIRTVTVRMEREVPEFQQVLQVHDADIGYVSDDMDTVHRLAHKVRAIATDLPFLRVPLDIDVSVGQSWATKKKLDLGTIANSRLMAAA